MWLGGSQRLAGLNLRVQGVQDQSCPADHVAWSRSPLPAQPVDESPTGLGRVGISQR